MRSPLRAFIDGVELPNHETAIRNLDFTNPRLRFRWRDPAPEVPNRLYGTTLTPDGDCI